VWWHLRGGALGLSSRWDTRRVEARERENGDIGVTMQEQQQVTQGSILPSRHMPLCLHARILYSCFSLSLSLSLSLPLSDQRLLARASGLRTSAEAEASKLEAKLEERRAVRERKNSVQRFLRWGLCGCDDSENLPKDVFRAPTGVHGQELLRAKRTWYMALAGVACPAEVLCRVR